MKNDWIIANINNPSFTAGDFKNIGLKEYIMRKLKKSILQN